MIKENLIASMMFITSIIEYVQLGIRTKNPDSSEMLDVASNNKGFLVPKIALKSASDATTILNPANGLTVYNINEGFSLI